MDERVKTDKGVIFAAILLKLMAAPFILLTVIGAIAICFLPLVIVDSGHSGYDVFRMFGVYVVFLGLLSLGYIISMGMMMMSEMMVSNHRLTHNRQSPKSRLYSLVDNLLIILGLELVVGAVLGFLISLTRLYSVRSSYQMGEYHYFLGVILIVGILVYFLRKYLMNLSWWRQP